MNGWCALLVLGLLGCGDDGGMPSADAPVLPKRPQWRDPALVMGITSSEDQGTPALRGDELELMFTQAAVGVGCSSFVRATRSSVTAAFAMPQAVTELNTAACEGSPTFGPDGRELFFVRGSGSAYKIFRAMRASLTDPFGTPTQVTELDIAAAQGSPSLTADGLVIVFTSGPMPGPAMNVYQAERASVSEPFGPPHQLAELGQVGSGAFGDGRLPGDDERGLQEHRGSRAQLDVVAVRRGACGDGDRREPGVPRARAADNRAPEWRPLLHAAQRHEQDRDLARYCRAMMRAHAGRYVPRRPS